MPIEVECSACRARIRVGDEAAGRRGKCPRCQAAIEIPAAAESVDDAPLLLTEAFAAKDRAVAPRASTVVARPAAAVKAVESNGTTRNPAQLLKALEGAIEPVRPTPLYRLWIVIVAGVMLVLPVIYIAILGLFFAALAWHAIHNLVLLQNVKNGKAAVLAYFGPLIAGAVAILFMFKPLFAASGKKPTTRTLDPERERVLFAFVDGICAAVGAPTPSRIEVDCEVNASASFASGPLAFHNNDLVLTIGLPLVAGLSLTQFAGVLAHEFGHFSQSAGMRLQYLIRSINLWFARVVYERDEWDEKLAAWSTQGNEYSMIIAAVARGTVWLTRRILWVLMLIGHAVSGFLAREMEFDADRYETRMVGGDVFTQTMNRVSELGLAAQGAYADLATSWNDHRLPDDLPKLVLVNVAQIAPEIREAFRQLTLQRRTGLFDTHPADKDRISRAQAEGTAGILRIEGGATDLFRHFESLARVTTFDHYRTLLGEEITPDQLYPVTEAVEGLAVTREGYEAFQRFFLNAYGLMQSLPLPSEYPSVPADLMEAKRELIEVRSAMLEDREANLAGLMTWDELDRKAVNAAAAAVLLKSGVKILKPAMFDLNRATIDAAEAARRDVESAYRDLFVSLRPFENATARRLTLALGLLESEVVAGRVPEGTARRDEAHALYHCSALLGNRILREILPVERAARELKVLLDNFGHGNKDQNESLRNACLRAGRQLRDQLQNLQATLGHSLVYPFEHADGEISVGRYLLPTVPDPESISDLIQATDEVFGKLKSLHHRILGRLAVTAEEVERTLGMEPLKVEVALESS